MTSATPLCCARCWAGIAKAPTSRRNCRCSQRCSGMSTRPTRSGISRARPSCWRWLPSGSSGPGRSSPHQSPPTGARTCRSLERAPDRDHTGRRHGRLEPMSALAPLLQAFFTERLARQRDASPHTIASYRDSFRLLLDVPSRADRQAAVEAAARGSQPGQDHRVPLLSGERARQQRPHPQRATDRDPLVLPLRGIESPGVRRADRARALDPREALSSRR